MTENKGDLISREALINVILNDHKLDGTNANWEVNRILVHINNAPTVENNLVNENRELIKLLGAEIRPQGEWVTVEDSVIDGFKECSNCGEKAEWLDGGGQFLCNFCPNCGADMRGKKNDNRNT